jgi:transglutaminase-like putative cysteine protease
MAVIFASLSLLLAAEPTFAGTYWPEVHKNIRDGGDEYIIVPTPVPEGVTVDTATEWVYEHIAYASDVEVWGGEYWQDSLQTLSMGTGDCEDKAILLVALLRSLGVSEDNVRVVAGMVGGGPPTPEGIYYPAKHVWAEFYDGTQWYVLDPTLGIEMTWAEYRDTYSAERQFAFNDIYGTAEKNIWPNYWKPL